MPCCPDARIFPCPEGSRRNGNPGFPLVLDFTIWSFEFVSDFGFSVSNFTVLDGIFLVFPANPHYNTLNRGPFTFDRRVI